MKTELLQQCNVCDGTALEVIDADCNIARCKACGYIFDNPRPTMEELIGFYSRPTQYDSWLAELNPRNRLWKRRLSKLRSSRKSGSLLDIGTGIGQFLALAREFYSSVAGTEVSTVAVQRAKEKYNLDLCHGTIEALRGQIFDNITLFHVLEHVPDPTSVLKTCHSLLSQGGVLVIAVPNEVNSLRASVKRLLARTGLRKQRQVGEFGLPRISLEPHSVEVHLSHFTPPVLNRLLRATGFCIIEHSLDPYYVATGMAELEADFYYYVCLLFLRIFKINIYDTMLVIARKTNLPIGGANGH